MMRVEGRHILMMAAGALAVPLGVHLVVDEHEPGTVVRMYRELFHDLMEGDPVVWSAVVSPWLLAELLLALARRVSG